jgi:hypothetical protein
MKPPGSPSGFVSDFASARAKNPCMYRACWLAGNPVSFERARSANAAGTQRVLARKAKWVCMRVATRYGLTIRCRFR